MLKLMGKKIFTFLAQKFCLSKPMTGQDHEFCDHKLVIIFVFWELKKKSHLSAAFYKKSLFSSIHLFHDKTVDQTFSQVSYILLKLKMLSRLSGLKIQLPFYWLYFRIPWEVQLLLLSADLFQIKSNFIDKIFQEYYQSV